MRPVLRAQGCECTCEHLRLVMSGAANTARMRGVGSAVGSGNEIGKNIHDVHSLSLEKNIVNHFMKNNCI